jgi:hypothetical protein
MVVDVAYVPNDAIKHEVNFNKIGDHPHSAQVIYTLTRLPRQLCEEVEIYMCGESRDFSPDVISHCVNLAINEGIKHINMSISGSFFTTRKEFLAFKRAAANNVQITLAAGNNSQNHDKLKLYPHYYGRMFKNVHVVGASDLKNSGYGSWVKKELGSIVFDHQLVQGTSMAAPRYMNKILQKACGGLN